jgi:hypothetical protein
VGSSSITGASEHPMIIAVISTNIGYDLTTLCL